MKFLFPGGFDLSQPGNPIALDIGTPISWGSPAVGTVSIVETDPGEYQYVAGFTQLNDSAYFIAGYAGATRSTALVARTASGEYARFDADSTEGSGGRASITVNGDIPLRISGSDESQVWTLYEDHDFPAAYVVSLFQAPAPIVGRVTWPWGVSLAIGADNPNYPETSNDLIGAGLARFDEGGGVYSSLICTVAGAYIFTATSGGFAGYSENGTAFAALQKWSAANEEWEALEAANTFVSGGIAGAPNTPGNSSSSMLISLAVGDKIRAYCSIDDGVTDDYWTFNGLAFLTWIRGMTSVIAP